MHSVHLHAEAHVLARQVPRPFPPRLDQQGDRIGRVALHPLDATTQLARGPQRIDQLQVVVRAQRRGEGPQQAERPSRARRDERGGAALSHALLPPRGIDCAESATRS